MQQISSYSHSPTCKELKLNKIAASNPNPMPFTSAVLKKGQLNQTCNSSQFKTKYGMMDLADCTQMHGELYKLNLSIHCATFNETFDTTQYERNFTKKLPPIIKGTHHDYGTQATLLYDYALHKSIPSFDLAPYIAYPPSSQYGGGNILISYPRVIKPFKGQNPIHVQIFPNSSNATYDKQLQ